MVNIVVYVALIAPRQWVTFFLVNAAVHTLCALSISQIVKSHSISSLLHFYTKCTFSQVRQGKSIPLFCCIYLFLLWYFFLIYFQCSFGAAVRRDVFKLHTYLSVLRFLFNLVYDLISNPPSQFLYFRSFPTCFFFCNSFNRRFFNILIFASFNGFLYVQFFTLQIFCLCNMFVDPVQSLTSFFVVYSFGRCFRRIHTA